MNLDSHGLGFSLNVYRCQLSCLGRRYETPEMLIMYINVLDAKYETLSRCWLEVHAILLSGELISPKLIDVFFFLVSNFDTHEFRFSFNVY